MPTEPELRAQLARLSAVLDQRIPRIAALDQYKDGDFPLPPLIQDERVTKAYRQLMEFSTANWPALIIDSVEERLEVQGIRFGDQAADDDVWEIWQENGLDAESSMLHSSTLTDGRAYAIVWGDGSTDPRPRVVYEHASMCAVEYEPGSRRRRRAAIRRWREGKRWYANLYLPDAIYKFQADVDDEHAKPDADKWMRREVTGEQWPLANPLEAVPVVEFAVNRSLRPSAFGTGHGEFATHLHHIDRINYKIFAGLVALTWSGFPLRALIGHPIAFEQNADGSTKLDSRGRPIARKPFDVVASSVVQIENPDGKLVQLPEANVSNYSPEEDIKHLAALTKTPAHYLLGELVNLSADAIRAAEAGLVSKTRRHHRSLGESHEEVSRLAVRVRDPQDPRGQDEQAEIIWRDPESRSLAERADAATKLASINMPWQVIGQMVLGMTPQEIARAEAGRGTDILTAMLTNPPAVNGANGTG